MENEGWKAMATGNEIRIETNRLVIIPLNYQQLINYLRCDNSLESELRLHPSSRTISPELQEAFEQSILPNVADQSKDYLYSTLWTAISKADHVMVGDICMVGEPNEKGEIEIGYGIYSEFQNRGLMTEIVGGMIGWAKSRKEVHAVMASTEKNNVASFQVLEKNGFISTGETDSLINWKLEID